jgi:hypothetical protein
MGRATAVRGGLAAVGLTLVAGAVAFVPPTADSFYPKCQFHHLTGLHCMGCGLTRSAHSLLNGRLLQSAAYHPLGPVLAAWLLAELGRRGLARWRGRPDPGWWFRGDWVPWLLAGLAVFMLLRNLPWWPLTLLAPHPLG